MKKAITIAKFIILAPIYLYLFIADRLFISFYPIGNQWHQNVALKHPNWWVVLLTTYRIVWALILFSIFKFIQYVFFS
jgi:hypothetical protein